MAAGTRRAVLAWIEAKGAAIGDTVSRLAVYATAVTDTVPEGWVRFYP
jgi:hypothetical protein